MHTVRGFHAVVQIGFLSLELLNANDIGAACGQVFMKAFFIGRTDAVYISRNDTHEYFQIKLLLDYTGKQAT